MTDRRKLFDEWAATYDDSVRYTTSFPAAGYEQVLSAITNLCRPAPGMEVLDLGTGTGNLARRFVELGCRVWATDFSEKMLEKARRAVPEATLVRFDLLEEWPLALERPFHRIVSSYVLHEFDLESKTALIGRLVSGQLRHDGLMVIGDIAFETVAAREEARSRWAERWEDEEHYWAADVAMAALRDLGLAVSYRQVSFCGGVFVIGRRSKPLISDPEGRGRRCFT